MRKIVFAALMFSASPAFAVTLMQADFTGSINGGGANVKAPFSGNGFSPNMPFSGTFVYDADAIPATGVTNVAIPADTVFNLSFGPLNFTLADGSQITPAVQYNNGAFNGFVYVSEFLFLGDWYQLRFQGTVLGVKLLTNVAAPGAPHGFVTGNNLINARVDTTLTNIRPYVPVPPGPAVPEPATWAMMIGGFALAGMALRRRPTVRYA